MITASNWTDYEILDTSCGEKLERWGSYLLIRPDPQVVWQTDKKDPGWRRCNAHYHRSSRGGGEWEFFDLPQQWTIGYQSGGLDLTFHLKPFSFKHTGLFPEQAANWDWFSEKIRNRIRQGMEVKVLNLFAYTGGATVAAAQAGAVVTHVDASKGMVGWARDLEDGGLHPRAFKADNTASFEKAAVLPAEFLYDGPVPGSADVSFERDARSHLRGDCFS